MKRSGLIVTASVLVFMGAFMFYPLLYVFREAFYPGGDFSLVFFANVFTNPVTRESIANSFLLASTATAATNIHDPVASSVLYLMGLQGSLNTLGGTFWIEDQDNTQLTGKVSMSGNTTFSVGPGLVPICKTSASKALAINTTGGGFHGVAQFLEETG